MQGVPRGGGHVEPAGLEELAGPQRMLPVKTFDLSHDPHEK
jgi:hypothetical protein